MVEEGQIVSFFDTIATIDYLPGRLVRCDVSFELGCEPQNVSQNISHKPGEWIEKGTVLVNYDRFFTKRVAVSPISGFYVFASKVLGYIFIREPLLLDQKKQKDSMKRAFEQSKLNQNSKKQTDKYTAPDFGFGNVIFDKFLEHTQNVALENFENAKPNNEAGQFKAGFSGVISSIEQQNEIVITSEGYRFQGVVGFGQQNFGKLTFLESLSDELQESEVPENLKESVVVIRGWPSLKALQKIEQVGAVGLVSGSIPLGVLHDFCLEEPLLYLGHQMPISMTLVMMQKFGEKAMLQEQYAELKSLEGNWCLVDGNTQLRAGCKRPEILVPIKTQEVEHATESEY
ncbi:MAG: hypothetical protein LLG05_17320 [Porphyromonadaceae bacterium]|nr:hypothetical protein [Porphyromonadaceae bacterium]